MTPRATVLPRSGIAALVLALAVALPLAGCDAVRNLAGGSSTSTTTDPAGTDPAGTDPGTSAASVPDGRLSPGATSTTAPALTLPPVDGYQYTPPPPAVSAQLANVSKQFDGVFTATSAKGVTRGGKTVAAVVQYGIDSSVTGTKAFDDKLLDSMLTGLAGQGAATRRESLLGQQVVSAFPKQGTGIVAWYREDVITLVLGADPAEARAYAMGYLKPG